MRVPAEAVEAVMDGLLPIAPNGVFDVARGGEVELRVRGRPDELPPGEAVLATAGQWLRWSGERDVPDDWLEQRRLDWEPEVIGGRLVLRPEWAPAAGDGLIDVVLREDTGAFGTGAHPTTRRCLEALLALKPQGAFADLGCGTGVLAIAAAKLGYSRVIALDREAEAVAATLENARANEVDVEAREADLTVEALPEAVVVAANVPVDLHTGLAAGLPRGVQTVIASGFVEGDGDAVSEGYGAAGFAEARRDRHTEWVVLVLNARGARMA